jgi:ABC-2 type transport system permease protein
MTTFTKLATVQFKLFLREPLAFFFTLIFPLLMLLLFGVVWGNDPSPFYGGYGYIDQAVPALTALIVGTVGFMSVPVATASAREHKILRRYRATPLRSSTYLAAEVSVYFLLALVSMFLLVVVGTLLFGLRFDGSWLAVLAGFTLSALAFVSAGYVIAGLAPTSRAAQVVGQLIFFPMMFLSGASIPLQIMPESVQNAAAWLPMTQMVKMLQGLWFGQGWNLTGLAVTLAVMVVGTLIAIPTFRWE